MRKTIWLLVATAAVLVGGFALLAKARGPEWTTSSSDALVQFEAALESWMKLYYDDAAEQLVAALELDPDFVAAKVFLADIMRREDPEEAQELVSDLESVDLRRLTARERLYVERLLALHEGDRERAQLLLDSYLEEHPRDPFILQLQANRAWVSGEAQLAERLNRQLVELSPNWVLAYNQLGYLTMQQGRFAEAEEYFKSYRFVAPDQANPHDSLGELFLITGRYTEAAASFERALAIRPDFWATYDHLVLVRRLQEDTAGALEVIERAARAGAPSPVLANLKCVATYGEMEASQAWTWILGAKDSGCIDTAAWRIAARLTHLAACELGRWEEATQLEARVQERHEAYAEEKGLRHEMTADLGAGDALLSHMVGVRLALQGDLEKAAERLEAADRELTYRQSGEAVFKVFNRLCLVETLRAAGRHASAYKMLAKVHEVNPDMGQRFEERGFQILGLPSRAPVEFETTG